MNTVICTAFRSNLSLAENQSRNDAALARALRLAHVYSFEHVTGFYQENISATPCIEESFLFKVSSARDVRLLRDLFCYRYGQDCILWVNDSNAQLLGKSWQETIGSKLVKVPTTKDLQAYTVLQDGTILTVK